MIETPNKAARINIIEDITEDIVETIGPIGKLWSLSLKIKHNLGAYCNKKCADVWNIFYMFLQNGRKSKIQTWYLNFFSTFVFAPQIRLWIGTYG